MLKTRERQIRKRQVTMGAALEVSVQVVSIRCTSYRWRRQVQGEPSRLERGRGTAPVSIYKGTLELFLS